MARLFNFSNRMSRHREKMNKLKQDPDRRKRVKAFGIVSIVFSLLTGAFGLSSNLFGLSVASNNPVFLIFGLPFALVGLLAGLIFAVYALIFMISQLVMNRGVMSWIAFAFFFIGLAAYVVLALFGFGVFA